MKIEFDCEKEREVFIGECGATLVLCSSISKSLSIGSQLVQPTVNNATACLIACGFTLDDVKRILAAENDMEAFKILGIDRYVAAAQIARSMEN